MKKFLILLLTFVLCFSFVACDETDESEPLVEMQEIQAVGTVNLAEELALFDSILANNYINIDGTIKNNGIESQIKLNAKRTEKGYDVVATITRKMDGVTVMQTNTYYYVDGVLIEVVAGADKKEIVNNVANMSFVDFVGVLNNAIYSQTESKLVYHVLKPIVSRFEGFKNLSSEVDYADGVNNMLSLVDSYKDRSVYDFVVEGLMGVDLSDEEATAKIKNDILEFCSGNPSVAVFIDKVEAYINESLEEENKINIKGYLNDLQQNSGITTKEFIECAKVNFPSISGNLREPEDGETIYDYIRSYLRVMSLNAFAKNVIKTDETFVEFIDNSIEANKNIKLEYAINWIISNSFKQENVNGQNVIGEHYAEFAQRDITFKNLMLKYNIEVDEQSRPIKLNVENIVSYSELSSGEKIFTETSLKIQFKLNYKKTGTSFKIPEEIL